MNPVVKRMQRANVDIPAWHSQTELDSSWLDFYESTSWPHSGLVQSNNYVYKQKW